MPNAPRPDNVAHTVRVPDSLWDRAKQRADERGETVSEAVRLFLDAYADGTNEAIRRFVKQIRRP